MNKLAGLGMKNLVLVALFVMIFVVIMKTVFTKYHVKGVSEVVQAV